MGIRKNALAEQGDRWSEWFERYSGPLVVFARQFTASHADAEDVVQQAFVRLWRKGGNRPKDPKPYLFASVKRIALDVLRSQRRRANRERTAAAAAQSDGEPVFHCPLELDEWRVTVESGLRALPVEQREVLVLRIWAELSFRQIADVLDIPVNTASSRYRYAISNLRQIIEGDCSQ